MLDSIQATNIGDVMRKLISQLPLKTVFSVVVVWILLVVLWIALRPLREAGILDYGIDIPDLFPISVFIGPTIHLSGIPYLCLVMLVLAYAIRFAPKLTSYQVWLISLTLIILGNLGQGNWSSAFIDPFYEYGMGYYNDAIKVVSWSEWLESFNIRQDSLLAHARTHPPFAVLSQYIILYLSNNSLPCLSIIFVFMSSLSIALMWWIFRILGVPLENRNLLALLFSVVPAVNIYSAVSLDGVILTSATLFLYGVVDLLTSARISKVGLLATAVGLTVTNLLSYGGVFLIAVAGILAFREFILGRRYCFAISLLISLGFFVVVAIDLYTMYGYNHVQGFLNASKLENPDGFRGWYQPLSYLATRVECISEIAFFLAFGVLAILFHPQKLGVFYSYFGRLEIGIMFSGLIALLVMFVSGAYHTGETARAAIFIYPYILLALKNADSCLLKDILILAGLQTVAMQLFGNYAW